MPPEQVAPIPVSQVPTPLVSNTSGQGKNAVVPDEVSRGWNWGAFGLTWIWGIGNSTWIAFLGLIPFVNFVMPIMLGIKGNEWAWRNHHWDSIESFKKAQRTWTIVWVVLMALLVVLWVGISFLFTASFTKDADPQAVNIAKSYVQAAFTSGEVSDFVSDAGFVPNQDLITYDQNSRGAFEEVAFNSFNMSPKGELTLGGKVIFANDSEPICITMLQFDGSWKILQALQSCPASAKTDNFGYEVYPD